jgi:hypothetical protein
MVDETPERLRAEIDHHRRLARLVTDAGVRAEMGKLIEELERRLRELDERRTARTQTVSVRNTAQARF